MSLSSPVISDFQSYCQNLPLQCVHGPSAQASHTCLLLVQTFSKLFWCSCFTMLSFNILNQNHSVLVVQFFVLKKFFKQSEPQCYVPLSNRLSKYSHLSSWMFPGGGWAGHLTPAHSWPEGSSSCCWRCCVSLHLPAAHQSALFPGTRRSSPLLTAGPEQKYSSINVQMIS